MEEKELAPEEEYIYSAFISYRHLPLDKEAAERIQKKIETYTIPKEFRAEYGASKLGRAFRDEDELPATSSLTDSIYYALDHARFLVVICTPDLPKSKWCEAEIKYFIQKHGRDRVIAVLADGDPAESFSPYLLHEYDEEGNIIADTEPLAANIVGENHTINKKVLNKEVVRIFAAILGCPFDALWQRERRAKTNRLLLLAGIIVAAMAIFMGVVINRNNMIEQQNQKISAQNEEILGQNEKIEAQNTELQSRLSSVLVDSGMAKLSEHDIKGALADGLSALQSNDPEIYDHRAGKLLSQSLNSYLTNEVRSSIVYSQSTNILHIRLSDNKKHILLLDQVGTLRCLDAETYDVLWDADTGSTKSRVYSKNLADRVITVSEEKISCHSLADGSLLWNIEKLDYLDRNPFHALSEDGTLLAYMDAENDSAEKELIFLNTKDGTEIGRVTIEDSEKYRVAFPLSSASNAYAAAFSSDNSLFACCVPITNADDNVTSSMMTLLVDLENMEPTVLGSYESAYPVFFGIDINPEDRSVFFAMYVNRSIYTVLYERKGEKYQAKETSFPHNVSSPGGINELSMEDFTRSECRFLSAKGRVYVMSDNWLFILDREKNEISNNYALSGTIVNAYWYEGKNDVLELATSDGYVFDYYIDYSPDKLLTSIKGDQFDLHDISTVCSLETGTISMESGAFLAASSENPGKLFLVKYVSDPNGKIINPAPDKPEEYGSFALFPGSDTGLYLFETGTDVSFFHKRTGEVTGSASFDDYLNIDGMILLDDTHFLLGQKVYCADGTTAPYAEPVKSGVFDTYPFHHVRLSDGRILSFDNITLPEYRYAGPDNDASDSSTKSLSVCAVWIDGKPVESLCDPLKTTPFYSELAMFGDNVSAGENGLIMVSGTAAKIEGSTFTAEESEKLFFIDALTEKVTVMDAVSPDPGAKETAEEASSSPDPGAGKTAMAHQKKLCAAAYDDGTLCIYDPEHETSYHPDRTYSTNEILSLCFSEDDKYLVVLTTAGQLDIYETDSFQSVFEGKPDILDYLRDMTYYAGLNMHAESVGNEVEDLLFIHLSDRCMIIDVSARVELSSFIGTNAVFDRDTDRIYKKYALKDSRIISFPAYDIPALKNMAEEALGK